MRRRAYAFVDFGTPILLEPGGNDINESSVALAVPVFPVPFHTAAFSNGVFPGGTGGARGTRPEPVAGVMKTSKSLWSVLLRVGSRRVALAE